MVCAEIRGSADRKEREQGRQTGNLPRVACRTGNCSDRRNPFGMTQIRVIPAEPYLSLGRTLVQLPALTAAFLHPPESSGLQRRKRRPETGLRLFRQPHWKRKQRFSDEPFFRTGEDGYRYFTHPASGKQTEREKTTPGKKSNTQKSNK